MPVRMTLSRRKKSTAPRKLAALILLASAGGAVYYGRHHRKPEVAAPAGASAESRPVAELPPVNTPQSGTGGAGTADPQAIPVTGPRVVSVAIHGPLETALSQSVGKVTGPALAQVVTRILVWWVAVPADLRAGDKLDIVFEERPSEEPLVHAVRFSSAKLGRTLSAYRYLGEGEHFARYFMPDGDELERRLAESPLENYEQITSLIKDGRHHKGVDFRTPVGTPVRATFAGTVTKKNWKWKANGNSVELTEDASPHRRAIFLHMSELPKELHVGSHLPRGAVLGQSGNTGHSFAPHLHYQLMGASDQVLDPFDGKTLQGHIAAEAQPALTAAVAKWDALITPTSTAMVSGH